MGAMTVKVQVRGSFRVAPCHPVAGRFSGSPGLSRGGADLWAAVEKKLGA
jgi:hypothetical protein